MTPDTRNMIAAASLSMLVLVMWQLYFVEPELEQQRSDFNAAQVQNDLPSASPESGDASAVNTATLQDMTARPSDDAMRVAIDTPLVKGSLTTKGARIDDITLTAYQETLAEDADDITLLRKISDNTPYFAEFGWIGDDTSIALPDASTIWTASSEILSSGNDVTLSWDNGEGLIFNRVLSIDDQYMITIRDEVTSAVR